MALAVHGFGIKNDASVRFTQRDGYPLGLGFQFISERNGTVKAGVVPGVAGAGAALVHQHRCVLYWNIPSTIIRCSR